MSNQLQITGGAKVRNLNGVITGTTGVLDSVPLGAANGVATLDSGGKVPVSQLPSSVVTYLGTWNAATNTPTLVNGTGDAGDMYICNVAGTVNFGAGPISFVVGDWVLYGSGTWQKSSGQNGTVTSVAVTETGDALTITGSPITTAGTINIGFAGTSAQYVAGDGTLITFPSLTGYVPYTGATTDVDLGTHVLNAQALHVKGTAGAGHLGLKHQTATPTGSANESLIFADVNGNLGWQNDNLYLSTFVSNANTANRTYTLQNASGTLAFLSDIPSLSASFPLSISSNTISISLASASTAGYLSIADWNTFNSKQNALTNPVTGTGNSGYVSIFTGTSTIGNSIIFQSTTRIGIMTTSPSTTLDVNGGGNFSGSIGALSFVKSGGTSSQFLKADGSVDSNTYISSLSASSPLSYNSGTGVISISAATGSTNGYLSSTDWLAFYAKQNAITLTTTGTSGPATLVGSTLNIPQYAAGVGGTGTTNYLSKWTASGTIGNGNVFDNGNGVIIGGTTGIAQAGTTYLSIQNNTLANSRGIAFYCNDGTQNPRTWIRHNTDSGNQYLAFDSTYSTANGFANFAFLNGEVLINTTTDSGYKLDVNGTSRFVGNSIFDASIGIGTNILTGYTLRLGANLTGATTVGGIYQSGTIQSDVTSAAYYNRTLGSTQAATFTLGTLGHYMASQGTLGAGSTVTNQYGFIVLSTLTGATNNYAFAGQLAAATNTWNLYMSGTANNYLAGNLGIGSTSVTAYNLRISKTITGGGGAIGYGAMVDGTVQSDITSSAFMYRSYPSTQAATFNITNLYGFNSSQNSLGAGTTVTNQYGYWCDALSWGTNVYGFYGAVASGTGRWNLYMNGTADNYLAGNIGIGSSQNFVSAGPILTTTLTNGGSGYVDGTYTDVASTNITGTGNSALFTVIVSSGIITSATLTWGGMSYKSGDTVTISNTLLGGTGSGLIITVATVDSSQLTIVNANGGDISLFRNDTSLTVTENIGSIKFLSNDISVKASGIEAKISAFGAGSSGGAYLSFFTSTGAGGALTEQLRIGNGGQVGIGGAYSLTGYSLRVSKDITGSTSSFGIINDGVVQSGVTTQATYIQSNASTAAASFTIGSLRHFRALQGTIGAGSTVTSQYGFEVDSSLIGATNNYGFYGNIASGTGRWNLYMAGTANNYLAGSLGVGTNAPSAGVTSYSTNAATQFKAAGVAPAFTFSDTLTSPTYGCVFGLATANGHFVTGTAPGDMAIANQSTTAGAIVFGTGTSEKMRMTSAGTFSIGNTNSTYTLDVSGTGRFTGALTGASATFSSSVTATTLTANGGYSYLYGLRISGNDTGNTIYAGNASMGITADSGNRIFIGQVGSSTLGLNVSTTNGNVGIGTSSPAVLLHSSPAATADLVTALFTAGNSDGNFKAGFANGSGTGVASEQAKIGMWYGTSGNPIVHFGLLRGNSADGLGITFNVNNSEKMRITGGNVLIGTTTDAGYKLDVNGITKTNGLSLGATTFTSSTTMTSDYFFWEFTGGAGITLTLYSSSGNNNTHFIKNSSSVSLTISGTIFTLSSGAPVSSITLAAYKTIQIISRAGGAWYIMYQTT